MTAGKDDQMYFGDEPEHDGAEPTGFRALLSTMWFRAVVVVVVVAGVAAVSIPYLFDSATPPSKSVVARVTPPEPAKHATPPAAKSNEPAPTVAATVAAAAPATPVAPASRSDAVSTSPTGSAKTPEPASASAKNTKPEAVSAAATKPATVSTPATKPDAVSAPARSANPEKTDPVTEVKRVAQKESADTSVATTGKRRQSAPATKKASPAGGEYWVQVGAFRDPTAARRVAERLRSHDFQVEESTTATARVTQTVPAATPAAVVSTPPGPDSSDRYDVFVAGTSSSDVSTKLTARGLAVSAVADGAVVKPSLPLRDAVALSKDLSADGFKVHVKRAGAAAPARVAAIPAVATSATPETLHRVRVGGFPDRAAALEARKKIEDVGYTGFVGRGRE